MTALATAVALFLLINLAATLLRVARGPSPADRMLAAILFATTGVAILMLGAGQHDAPSVDVALVLALLAAIAGIAFARRAWHRAPPRGSDDA